MQIIKQKKASGYLVQLRKTKNGYLLGGFVLDAKNKPAGEFIEFGGSVGLPLFRYQTKRAGKKVFSATGKDEAVFWQVAEKYQHK